MLSHLILNGMARQFNKNVTVPLRERDKQVLEDIAYEQRRDLSEVLREAIDRYVKEQRGENIKVAK